MIPARLADAPVLPDECRDTWLAFLDLHRARPAGGMSAGNITYSEIDAYQRLTGSSLEPWQVRAIRAADGAFREVEAEDRS